MNYKQQLLQLILENNEDAMMDWISSQPLIEQPDIFRALKELGEEVARENGDVIQIKVEGFNEFTDKIDHYEETILDEKLAEAQYVMALDDMEKSSKEMFDRVEGMREYVIECITTNAPNAKEMRDLAQHIIHFEKETGVYDPDNWKAIN